MANVTKIFQIDGIDMPKPSDIKIGYRPLTESERAAGTGEFIGEFKRAIYEITWHYKIIEEADFLKIFNQYIMKCMNEGMLYHTITTYDPNQKKNIGPLNIYTQGDFTAQPYWEMEDTGTRYENIDFVFITR